MDSSLDSNAKMGDLVEGSVNVRASYLAGQEVYGAAILASIGYKWKSKDLFYEDVSIQSYYRSIHLLSQYFRDALNDCTRFLG